MSILQLEAILSNYETKLEAILIKPGTAPKDLKVSDRQTALRHCSSLVIEAKALLRQKESNRAELLIKFIQGVFWSQGIYTLKEIENHNLTFNAINLNSQTEPANSYGIFPN